MKTGMLTLVACTLMGVGSFAQNTPKTPTPAQKAKQDSLEYAIGAYVMQNLSNNGVTISNQTLFKKAIDDVLTKKKLMLSDKAIKDLVENNQNAVAAQLGLLMEQQLFTELSKQKNVVRMPSGVNYAELSKGNGRRPDLEDTVVLNIIGLLPDGRKFINTAETNESYMLLIKDLVPGLQDAVIRMPEGSVWRVYVPAVLAYGATGNGSTVPPNTPVIYDVALVQVRKK
jgi:FKBP-type peptidyl-prolyl cis-trans isomerase FklB